MVKKIPNEIKKLTGSRHYNPLVPTADGKPVCPSWLSDYAKLEWRYIVPLLDAKHILDKTDRSVLIAYCDAVGRLREATEALKDNLPVITTKNDNLIQSPWVGIRNKAAADVVKFSSELGMSPTARGRVEVKAAGGPPSLAEILFND